jgi:hypothetical protein
MNLLHEFLRYLNQDEKEKLKALRFRGAVGKAWQLFQQQATEAEFQKEKMRKELEISTAHFDKISSEILTRCYAIICPEPTEILLFLSRRTAYIRHFYAELQRQMKRISRLSEKQQAVFCRFAFNCIHQNMPIVYKDEKVLQQLAQKFFSNEKDKRAQMLIKCSLVYVQIDKLFAASKIQENEWRIQKKIEALGPLPANATDELVYNYYWLWIYFYHALENFGNSLSYCNQAVEKLKTFKTENSAVSIFRIEMKISELLYYQSKFEKSFQKFKMLSQSKWLGKIPDWGYYSTKYLQVSLITGHLKEAESLISEKTQLPFEKMKRIIIVRDIISCAKFYLFARNYEKSFEFIQLGFEKNPKGKYVQYEIELRNLHTACFYLSGKKLEAVQMCGRNIKYLRSHGYGIKNSFFPAYYVLVKAIYEKQTAGKNFSEKEISFINRYQMGSYGIYGKLLLAMLHK